jgi:Cytochrome C oxidase, cbb3-type, subunit III
MAIMTVKLSKQLIAGVFLLLPLAGCTRDNKFQPVDMWNDSRLKPYEAVEISSGSTAMTIPAGTLARGQLRENDALYTGKLNGQLVTDFPIAVTEKVLARGQERYTIFCAPCHGGLGDGKGIIVQRGFAKPPDYMLPRLLDAPVGHFYDVIANGYGAMYSYSARIPVNDRWAIAAYIRLLQKTRVKGSRPTQSLMGGGVYTDLKSPGGSSHDGVAVAGAEHGEHKNGADGQALHGVHPADGGHGSPALAAPDVAATEPKSQAH